MLYPGVGGVFVPVASPISGKTLEKGDSEYVFGILKTGATQLPIGDTNVAFETASVVNGAVLNSISVNLQGANESQPPPMVCVEMHYNGAPGAGEVIAVQEADTDADGFYITPTNAAYTTNTFNTNNAARTDLSPTGGKFMRIQRTVGANAVGCTVKITRLA